MADTRKNPPGQHRKLGDPSRREFLVRSVVTVGAAGLALARAPGVLADTYLSTPGNGSQPYPYGYVNTFPKGVGTYPTSEEVGGDVFALGPQAGNAFPTDITLYDENDHEVPLKNLMNKPLVIACVLIAAPRVMKALEGFQKVAPALRERGYNVIALNVSDVYGVLLKTEAKLGYQVSTGRTIKATAPQYKIKLPFYYVNNDQYDPKGFTNRLRLRDLPTVYVLDKGGTIKKVFGSNHTHWSPKDFA